MNQPIFDGHGNLKSTVTVPEPERRSHLVPNGGPGANRSDIEIIDNWFKQQCNGDREHQYCVQITTTDNPGWTIYIDLEGTSLANAPMFRKDNGEFEIEVSGNAGGDGVALMGYCDAGELSKLIAAIAAYLEHHHPVHPVNPV